ncbi:MAG: RNA 2'-phosphotransferase [Myxococcales bacterium]|nr:RNA 2'-phosphotransferase [Myxococcales bacterium]MCB9668812.1 RNA 2'-phosphotransferase [Alphaproteobacteria bacterium]MCB9691390.1 RNA 2'-phosphotransferase [Alphaproteobacteria bacterium]
MNDPMIVKKSKKLSWLLRHGANEAGLAMDAAGWARVEDVCRYLRMSEQLLDRVIAENNKGRLVRDGDRVRCCQGHSTANMPVTQEALEASWDPWTGDGPIVHGTSVAAAHTILAEGIRAMARTHVHLASDESSKVGKRAAVAVLLDIDPTRIDGVWVSENGVILAREVPAHAIVGVRGATKNGRAAEAELRARLSQSPGHHVAS